LVIFWSLSLSDHLYIGQPVLSVNSKNAVLTIIFDSFFKKWIRLMDRLSCAFAVEIKANGAGDGCFSGYGSVFGNVDSYGDIVAKGAFKKSLQGTSEGSGQWPAMLLQHGGSSAEDQTPIGIWTKAEEDDNGLLMEGKLALDTRRGAEAYALLKMTPRPALNGLSIGYQTIKSTLHKNSSSTKHRRTLDEVKLVEVSLVTFPANTAAMITSVKADEMTIRQFEELLRDAGNFSHAQAKAIAASGFKNSLRDEDGEDDSKLAALIEKATKLFKGN
jgi:HK97 family phage prohead protease